MSDNELDKEEDEDPSISFILSIFGDDFIFAVQQLDGFFPEQKQIHLL